MWNKTDEYSRIFAETYFQTLADSKAAPTAFCVALRQLTSARATGAKDSSGIPLDHAIYWAAFFPLIGAEGAISAWSFSGAAVHV